MFLGVLFSKIFCLAAAGVGDLFFGRALMENKVVARDPAARWGLAGLLGLGLLGTLSFFITLIPGALYGYWVVLGVVTLVGGYRLVSQRQSLSINMKREGWEWLIFLCMLAGYLLAVIAVLAPSTAADWDSIAYHMAVPKLYIAAGHMIHMTTIHQSHFPSDVEILFVWGLQWGGQAGAKAIVLFFTFFGVVALYGLARSLYGPKGAAWASALFFGAPTVLWETGTAYIDVAHGLYAGLGLLLLIEAAARRATLKEYAVPGLLFGFALGTKYTGLETLIAACLAVLVLLRKDAVKPILLAGVLAVLVSCPWYIKNIVWERNPTYPFLFGGKDWTPQRSKIYSAEQLSFGVGVTGTHHDWSYLGSAILGLAYQPGRYINPLQTKGGGSPEGAIGFPFFIAVAAWCLVKRPGRLEAGLLGACGVSFLFWFELSQQSRYIVNLLPPGAILAAGAVESVGVVSIVTGAAIAVQGFATLWIQKTLTTDDQIQVALGKVDRTQYLSERVPFYNIANTLNAMGPGTKVGLFDEVFGYYLNIPYIWANPNHSRLIHWSDIHSDKDFVEAFQKQGVNMLYVAFADPAHDRDWVASLGIAGPAVPLPPGEFEDWMTHYKRWITEGVADRLLTIDQANRHGVLFEISAPAAGNLNP